MPFPFLLPTEKQGRGAAHGGGPRGLAAAMGRGKGREGLGEPVPHLDLGRGAARRSVHGGGRRATEVSMAAALGGSGGCCAAVEAAVELGGEEGGLLIGMARRWRFGGTRWRPASGAGRH